MYLNLLACEIMVREACQVIARSPHICDVTFLDQGYHDRVDEGRAAIQAAIDLDRPTPYDGVLLGYGLCNNLLVGLRARSSPLIVPRAHDCITLFLGNKERYLEYFQSHPGVYFKTSGWIERGDQIEQLGTQSVQHRSGMTQSYEELVARYGEDNARFLHEQLTNMLRNYSGYAYIEMGIEPDDRFERTARQQAAERGWTFEKLQGDMSLVQSLVDGPWDEERFLVIPPGHQIATSFDDNVICAVPARPDGEP